MLKQEIERIAMELGSGEITRTNCPLCEATWEKSLVVGRDDRDGHVWWKCWRVKCGWKGVLGVTRVTPAKTVSKKPRKLYHGEVRELNYDERKYLYAKHRFGHNHIAMSGVKYDDRYGRYAYPIYSPRGITRGWSIRTYDEHRRPKVLTFLYSSGPRSSFYRGPPDTNEVWIVEDIPSAVRLSSYRGAVSLQGTDFTQETIEEIAGESQDIVWALDEDATGKAIRYCKEHRLMFRQSRVRPLTKDIKNMQEEELQELLGVTRTTNTSQLPTKQGFV